MLYQSDYGPSRTIPLRGCSPDCSWLEWRCIMNGSTSGNARINVPDTCAPALWAVSRCGKMICESLELRTAMPYRGPCYKVDDMTDPETSALVTGLLDHFRSVKHPDAEILTNATEPVISFVVSPRVKGSGRYPRVTPLTCDYHRRLGE
jgi:hypothetical protein